MFADYHVHSAYSDDSDYPLEQVIRDAVAMGMDEICLTDHVDYGIKVDWDEDGEIPYYGSRPRMNVDYPRYMAQLHELQQRYGDRIRIKIGLEFGMQTHTIPRYRALMARYPLDFVILSIHQVGDQEFWTQDFQRGKYAAGVSRAILRGTACRDAGIQGLQCAGASGLDHTVRQAGRLPV